LKGVDGHSGERSIGNWRRAALRSCKGLRHASWLSTD
jgi:hypothetical protein